MALRSPPPRTSCLLGLSRAIGAHISPVPPPRGPPSSLASCKLCPLSRPLLTGTQTWSCGKRRGLRGRWILRTSRWPAMRTQVRRPWGVLPSWSLTPPWTLASFVSPSPPVARGSPSFLWGLSQAASRACVDSPSSLPAGSPWGLPPPLAGCLAPFLGGPLDLLGGMLFRPGWQAHIPVGQAVESWGQTVMCGERQAHRAGPVTILGDSWVSGFLWGLYLSGVLSVTL